MRRVVLGFVQSTVVLYEVLNVRLARGRCPMEVPYSQLGAGADAVDEDATQPLPGGEDGASQPLPADGKPRALFSCQYGTQHGAAPTFSLDVRHGKKVFLGRPDCRPDAPARSLAAPFIALTTSAKHGISRDNGWIEYDRHRGVVLVPVGRLGMPTFLVIARGLPKRIRAPTSSSRRMPTSTPEAGRHNISLSGRVVGRCSFHAFLADLEADSAAEGWAGASTKVVRMPNEPRLKD